MKKFFLLATALCFAIEGLFSQASISLRDGSLKKLTQREQDSIVFSYPDFEQGMVLFRNGSRQKAELNYNHYSQQLLYKQANDKGSSDILRVTNMNDIQMVSIGEYTYLPVGNALAQILVDDVVSLLASRKVNAVEKKMGAYGTGGNTSAITNLTSYDAGTAVSQGATADGAGTSYAGSGYGAGLDRSNFGPNTTLTVDYKLFLLHNQKAVPLTKKALIKAFPKSQSFIENYLNEQKPNMSSAEEMTKLLGLCIHNEKNF